MKTKRCTFCGQEKPLGAFTKDNRSVDGRGAHCKQCHNERYLETTEKWMREHPENFRDAQKKYRETHKEERKKSCQAWRIDHPDQIKQKTIEWRAKNPDKVKASKKRYNDKANKTERVKIYKSEWSKRHKDIVNAKTHRHRAKKSTLQGTHTAADIRWLRELQQNRCLACGKQEPSVKLEVDHIVSAHDLGWNSIENLQLLCRSCNASKGKKTIDYRSKALKKAIFKQYELF